MGTRASLAQKDPVAFCGKREASEHLWIDFCPIFRAPCERFGIAQGVKQLLTTVSKQEFAILLHLIVEMKFLVHEYGDRHDDNEIGYVKHTHKYTCYINSSSCSITISHRNY